MGKSIFGTVSRIAEKKYSKMGGIMMKTISSGRITAATVKNGAAGPTNWMGMS